MGEGIASVATASSLRLCPPIFPPYLSSDLLPHHASSSLLLSIATRESANNNPPRWTCKGPERGQTTNRQVDKEPDLCNMTNSALDFGLHTNVSAKASVYGNSNSLKVLYQTNISLSNPKHARTHLCFY